MHWNPRKLTGHRQMKHALQYFMHYGPAAFRFELAGELDTEGARRMERDWLSASSVIGEHALIVDLTFVTGAEREGRMLLTRWYAAGARFVAQSKVSRKLVEAITGKPLSEFSSAGTPGKDGTYLPFRKSLAA
jgi:hypothetical protein